MSTEKTVRYDVRDGAAILTIDRPERRNSLSRQTLYDLGAHTARAIQDESVRAIVVTGAGDKAFCAGADLKERQGMSENDIRVQVELYRSQLGPLARSPKPVVAAMAGIAFGGGLELALVCDMRVARESVLVALPETTLGIIPGAGGTQRLTRLVGEARAKEMILLGRRLQAREAQAWGIINHVVPDDADVVAETLAWIEPVLRGAPIAQAAALEAIDRATDVPLELGLELEKVSYDKTLVSDDRREALAAFAEKRKPTFKGC